MAVLGYNIVGSSWRHLVEGYNGAHNVLTYITPATDFVVNSFTFCGECQYLNWPLSMYFGIGTLTPVAGMPYSTITWVPCGDAGPYGYINWHYSWGETYSRKWRTYTYTTEPLPYLTAGTTYVLAIAGLNKYYDWSINYNTDVSQTENTHWFSGKWAGDEPERQYSIYVSGEPAVSGPSIKVDGITPGKIEQVSWSDVSDVQ